MNPDEAQDQLLVCADCGAQFTFTAKEKAFYKERGFMAPRRCRACRDKRKAATGGGPPGGGYQRASPWAPAGPSHGYGQGGAGRGDRQYFKVICAGCGTETTVPFKPDPNRPAYCRKCYASRRRQGPGQPPGPTDSGAPPAAPPADQPPPADQSPPPDQPAAPPAEQQ